MRIITKGEIVFRCDHDGCFERLDVATDDEGQAFKIANECGWVKPSETSDATYCPKEHNATLADFPTAPASRNPADMLRGAFETCSERNKLYGDNYKRYGYVMAVLFPNGVTLSTPEDYNRWHMFEQTLNKVVRFAVSGLTHEDSIHDLVVYAAMLESLTLPDAPALGESVAEDFEG